MSGNQVLFISHDASRAGAPKRLLRFLRWFKMATDIPFRTLLKSGGELEPEFEKYRIPASPEKIFDLLYYATLLIGDTQTMTTEAGLLGTPAIRCNSFVGPDDMSNFIELEHKYDLIYSFRRSDEAIQKAVGLLKQSDIKERWVDKRKKLFDDKIDVTRFVVNFVEDFPESFYSCKREERR